MNKLFLCLFILLFLIAGDYSAQTTMDIHQNNGIVLKIPISEIDSITYSLSPSNLIKYNGDTYPTITLGNGQQWLAENLRSTKYNDGTDIPLLADNSEWSKNLTPGSTLPMMCWYNNDQSTYSANKFGALYNWYAINPSSNGNKNVCPTGWHVPTDADWNTLIGFLDSGYDSNAQGTQSTIAGGKLKSAGIEYWSSPNYDASNESKFSGLPGGIRIGDGSFDFVGEDGHWWSSTENDALTAWGRVLDYGTAGVVRNFGMKRLGASVRCLKD